MPGLKARPPVQNRCGKSDSSRVVAAKMTNFAAAELPKPDPQQVLRKRLRAEMEALRGLVKKAEILAGKAANNVPAPRRRFLEAEARVDAKKRKAMPIATIVESRRMVPSKAVNDAPAPRRVKDKEARRADARPEAAEEQSTACAKKRKTMEIVEPRMPTREIVSRGSLVSSLSTNMPTTHVKEVAKNASVSICQSPPGQREEGEIVEEGGDDDEFIDICGGASPVPAAHDVRCSSPGLLELKKTERDDELVVGEASPVAVQKLAEAENSPSSSNSSSSGSSCSDSSDSDSSRSSGSSCRDSSDSDGSDSDDDAESVGSSPAPAVPAKRNVSPEQVSSKVLCSPPCSREEGEIPKEECVGSSPVAAEKFAESGNSPRSTSSFSLSRSADDESVESSPAPIVLPNRYEAPQKPQTDAPFIHQATAVPAPPMSNLLAKARLKMRQLRREPKRQKAYEELEAMDRNAVPTNWIHPMYMMEFGITVVEYVVTSDRLVAGRGGPLEQLFGLSWKGE